MKTIRSGQGIIYQGSVDEMQLLQHFFFFDKSTTQNIFMDKFTDNLETNYNYSHIKYFIEKFLKDDNKNKINLDGNENNLSKIDRLVKESLFSNFLENKILKENFIRKINDFTLTNPKNTNLNEIRELFVYNNFLLSVEGSFINKKTNKEYYYIPIYIDGLKAGHMKSNYTKDKIEHFLIKQKMCLDKIVGKTTNFIVELFIMPCDDFKHFKSSPLPSSTLYKVEILDTKNKGCYEFQMINLNSALFNAGLNGSFHNIENSNSYVKGDYFNALKDYNRRFDFANEHNESISLTNELRVNYNKHIYPREYLYPYVKTTQDIIDFGLEIIQGNTYYEEIIGKENVKILRKRIINSFLDRNSILEDNNNNKQEQDLTL